MKLEQNLLSCIEINPDKPAVASVIWLHGLGADGNDFAPIVKELLLPPDKPIRFVFPNAPLIPVTINNGYVMRAWYDIVSMGNIDQRVDRDGIQASVQHINRLIAHEESLGVSIDKMILAGFSQGAVIALNTGLQLAKPLAGILALSGYFPFAEEVMKQANPHCQKTSIFCAHGTEDTVIPFGIGQAVSDVLKKNHFSVSWHAYQMGHSVCGEEIRDIGEWLRNLV